MAQSQLRLFKALALNAVAQSFVITLVITLSGIFKNKQWRVVDVILTFVFTFIAYMITYYLFDLIFGYKGVIMIT